MTQIEMVISKDPPCWFAQPIMLLLEPILPFFSPVRCWNRLLGTISSAISLSENKFY